MLSRRNFLKGCLAGGGAAAAALVPAPASARGNLERPPVFHVLQDPAVRAGVKRYAQWPTIPQLYIDGEFIGGCDIVREMDASGELADKLAPLRG
ncbi:MAG TPA: glutaredoxin domain-containing protein [Nannocystaceae bacterium]|nr:glutaredoxin domain-containing protein [Nannocystaceae bacterium]